MISLYGFPVIPRSAMAAQQTHRKHKRQQEDTTSSDSFQEYWTDKYNFIERNGKPFCLLYDTSLSENSFKKLNL